MKIQNCAKNGAGINSVHTTGYSAKLILSPDGIHAANNAFSKQ